MNIVIFFICRYMKFCHLIKFFNFSIYINRNIDSYILLYIIYIILLFFFFSFTCLFVFMILSKLRWICIYTITFVLRFRKFDYPTHLKVIVYCFFFKVRESLLLVFFLFQDELVLFPLKFKNKIKKDLNFLFKFHGFIFSFKIF